MGQLFSGISGHTVLKVDVFNIPPFYKGVLISRAVEVNQIIDDVWDHVE